ncbi:MAG TPA: TRAP transporter substrate-binding protein DctP [Devosiaceae bacterium]|jgi:TRAP-type C4-dicarboxylate transport system substrate-binding protein
MKKLLGSLVMSVALGWSFSAAADPVHLKFAFANPDTDTIWVSTIKPFIDKINAVDPTKLVIDGFPNGALGKNLAQQPQLVQSGVADIAFVIPSVTPGRFADTDVLGLPGLFSSLAESTAVHTAMAEAGDFDSYKDFFVLGAFGSDPFSIHTVKPVASLDDLKGMKIRSAGGIQSHVLQSLGATPVFMGFPDVPEALGRRNLDGVAIQLVPLLDQHLTRIVTQHYFMDVGGSPIAMLMNKAKFDSLPADVQQILTDHRHDMADFYTAAFAKRDADILRDLGTDAKQKMVIPSPADKTRIDAAYADEIKAWTGGDAAKEGLLTKLRDELQTVQDGNK